MPAAAGRPPPPAKIDIVVSDVGDTARQAAAPPAAPSGGKRSALFIIGALLVAAIGAGIWLSKQLRPTAPSEPPPAPVVKTEPAPPEGSGLPCRRLLRSRRSLSIP
jgi:hypothetical protein